MKTRGGPPCPALSSSLPASSRLPSQIIPLCTRKKGYLGRAKDIWTIILYLAFRAQQHSLPLPSSLRTTPLFCAITQTNKNLRRNATTTLTYFAQRITRYRTQLCVPHMISHCHPRRRREISVRPILSHWMISKSRNIRGLSLADVVAPFGLKKPS